MRISEGIRQKGSFLDLLISIFAVVVYIALIWTLSGPLLGWLAVWRSDVKGLSSAAGHDTSNALYPYLFGRYHYLNIDSPDPDAAIRQYKRSLMLSPLQAGVWTDLSKAYQTMGQAREAEYSLERAVRLNPNDPHLMWEAGTFWLINGMPEKAVGALKRCIQLEPGRQMEVYDLCWKLRLDNNYIFSSLVPGNYAYRSKYLMYLMRTKRTGETQDVWKAIDRNSLEQGLFIEYINFLINSGLYEKAAPVWKEITGRMADVEKIDQTPLVWNANFEHDILNGGFDWVISETEGADVFIDDAVRMNGNRSLGVTFDGSHNLDITIAQQIVQVTPGMKYALKGYFKTDSLTTTNGVFLQVDGHTCSGISMKSETVTGTNLWREVAIDFDAPSGCKAVVLKIRRERSAKLDNKIMGVAWIDGITLRQRADILKTSFRRP